MLQTATPGSATLGGVSFDALVQAHAALRFHAFHIMQTISPHSVTNSQL